MYIENSSNTGGLQPLSIWLPEGQHNLFIMPYNYPKLIPLIGKQHIVYVCIRGVDGVEIWIVDTSNKKYHDISVYS